MQQLTVTYPGRPGAHSAAAATALHPDADSVPAPGFGAVVAAVERADAQFGVLPIESSLGRPVTQTHDLLFASRLSIVGETVLPIRHCLVGHAGARPEGLRVVRSHPSALEQCRRLLDSLPGAAPIAATTTADAAREVAGRGDPSEAAIAGANAARLYGLAVLADDVGDAPAFTRFVSIAPFTRLDTGPGSRTAFSFVTNHRPGALHFAIEPLARAGLDLIQLVSRPLPDSQWRYRFDAVLAGHVLDPSVRRALVELRARTRSLRVLGVYPEGTSVETRGG